MKCTQKTDNDCMFHQMVMHTQKHAMSACYAVLWWAMLAYVSCPNSDSADKIICVLLKKNFQHSY